MKNALKKTPSSWGSMYGFDLGSLPGSGLSSQKTYRGVKAYFSAKIILQYKRIIKHLGAAQTSLFVPRWPKDKALLTWHLSSSIITSQEAILHTLTYTSYRFLACPLPFTNAARRLYFVTDDSKPEATISCQNYSLPFHTMPYLLL